MPNKNDFNVFLMPVGSMEIGVDWQVSGSHLAPKVLRSPLHAIGQASANEPIGPAGFPASSTPNTTWPN
jgi:hypothetical protein